LPHFRPKFAILALGAALLTGGGCSKAKSSDPGVSEGQRRALQTRTEPGLQGKPQKGALGLELSEGAREELGAVLSDEFCYCGCPHTLQACLVEHPDCAHAKRAALLAAAEVSAGAPATEVIVLLGRYYQSFREPRAALEVDPRMCQGPPEAKVTLAVFSDFECPYCAVARPLLEAFTQGAEQVRLCFLPYFLQNHPNAIPAAQAALAARDQGAFWKLHDLLFEHQLTLSRERIVELGTRAGLSAKELTRVLASERHLDELRAFKEQGRKAGVEGTPAVFVNGRKLLLPLSEVSLGHATEDELEWLSNGGKWAAD
jgi:protein-disulfide isomerase